MTKIRGDVPLREIRTLFGMGSCGDLTDGELLERFSSRRSADGEPAFAALVDRHGRMVLRVCRGVLRDPNDVEDAFQATFLILATKARSLWVRDSIGPWLFGVAYRVAVRAQADSARRIRHERRAAERSETVGCADHGQSEEQDGVLHQELERLPDRYRAPLVLCYLEEMSQEQAARQLGWPLGTVRSRLARGRDRLRARLHRRGLAPMLVVAAKPPEANRAAGIHATRLESTAELASRFTFKGAAAAGVDPVVVTLIRGVTRTMILSKLSKIAAVLLVAGFAATGAVGYALQEGPPTSATSTEPNPPARALAYAPPEKPAAPPRSEAEQIADRVLMKGSALFNTKNAAGLAATYTEDGEIYLISKADDRYKEDVKRGRIDIEAFYGNLFRDAATIESENTVEFARLIAPDLLVIHGRFRPNKAERELPFVQMRIKQGGEWLIRTLWLFLSPG